MSAVKNYYNVIGVPESATEEEIKSAYRKLAKKFHPDTHPGDPECERKFREVNEAYSILGDSQKRKEYNKKIADTKFAKGFGQGKNFFGFHPETKAATNEEKIKPGAANPLDTTELFERFMGMKR